MKTILVFLFICSVSAFLWLAWQNRESEKVILALVSIVGAAAAAMAATFVFADPVPLKAKFPVSFCIDRASGLPTSNAERILPVYNMSNELDLRDIWATHREAFSDRKFDRLGNTYHQILQRMLLDILKLLYSGSWRAKFASYDLPATMVPVLPLPFADLPAKDSATLTEQQIEAEIPTTSLARKPLFSIVPTFIKLPRGTKFHFSPPRVDENSYDTGEIQFENSYALVSIRTRTFPGTAGLGWYTPPGEDGNPLRSKYLTLNYEVEFTATFSRWKIGNPKTPLIRDWAQTMLEMLQNTLDETLIMRRTFELKQRHVLLKDR